MVKLVMLPLLFSMAYLGFEHRDMILDQYNAAYPSDPAKQAAIEECITKNRSFNRLDPDDRKYCYRQNLPAAPVALAPAPSPSYAYSPSHLPGNDVRRQEANSDYRSGGHSGGLIPSAEAAPVTPTAVPTLPAATPQAADQRKAVAHHRAAAGQHPTAASQVR